MNALAFAWNPAWPFRRLMLSETRGIWCLIDADDWWWISERRWNWGWHANTPWKHYAKRNIGAARSTVYLHREILIRHDPRTEVWQWTHHGSARPALAQGASRRCGFLGQDAGLGTPGIPAD